MMITVLLPTAELTSDDALRRAFAVAITHAHHRTSVLVKLALT